MLAPKPARFWADSMTMRERRPPSSRRQQRPIPPRRTEPPVDGALMRTAPVGLAYLDSPTATAQAAVAVAGLTHDDQLVDESCILWTEAIRNAVVTGEIAIRPGIDLLRPESRDYWTKAIDDAEAGNLNTHQNGFTVGALQCSWKCSAFSRKPHRS